MEEPQTNPHTFFLLFYSCLIKSIKLYTVQYLAVVFSSNTCRALPAASDLFAAARIPPWKVLQVPLDAHVGAAARVFGESCTYFLGDWLSEAQNRCVYSSGSHCELPFPEVDVLVLPYQPCSHTRRN